VCHADSNKTGFLKESKLICWAQVYQVNSDYHSEINAELFIDCLINHFINYLEEGSIIVVDNASFH
jgi:hypothetical protein